MYVAEHVATTRRIDLEDTEIECIWLEVTPKGCNIYRPPNSAGIWMTNLEKSLINASKETMDLVLMGDFNIYLLVKKKCKKLIDITESFQLQQLIKIPTRISETTETLIDHIYVKNCDKVTSEVLPWDLSDHSALMLTYHNK